MSWAVIERLVISIPAPPDPMNRATKYISIFLKDKLSLDPEIEDDLL